MWRRVGRVGLALGMLVTASGNAAGCGGGEFAGDGVLRGRVVVCDSPPPITAACHAPTWKRPGRTVSVIARAIDGSGNRVGGAVAIGRQGKGHFAFPMI